MDKLENFMQYNLINYMKNYSYSLQASNRTISVQTFNFFFELSSILIDTSQINKNDTLDDEELELLQSTSERRYKWIAKSKLRNKSIDQNSKLNFLSDFNELAIHFLKSRNEDVPEKFQEIFALEVR